MGHVGNNPYNPGAPDVDSQAGDDQLLPTFYCRALYDYQPDDNSSLSFHAGDIIEVLTQLETGWWDGLLGEERGWFPSNYVLVISETEAEAELGNEYVIRPGDGSNDTRLREIGSGLESDQEWLQEELEYAQSSTSGLTNGVTHNNGPANNQDFWLPQVDANGQVRTCELLSAALKSLTRIS